MKEGWNHLSLKEKAEYIRLGIKNGLDLLNIKLLYNWYHDLKNNQDYDMNAYFNDNKELAFSHIEGKHFPDTYKKPNHPTFSDESIYSTLETPGGHWDNLNGKDVFYPSEWLIETFGTNYILNGMLQQGDSNVIPVRMGGVMLPEIDVLPQQTDLFASGGNIHIKPENKGKFTELKERTGKSSTWYKENGTPEQKKMATFALNARKWSHKHDGIESDSKLHILKNNKRNREDAILSSNKVFNNYIDAKDNLMSKLETTARIAARYLSDWGINPFGSGISNCTLSASLWVNPDNPLMRAASIVEDSNPYFTKISEEYAIPGDLLITKNPKHNSYHTMMITGFENDIPLLTYSSEGTNTEKNLKKNISLSDYHQKDMEQGGNHTEDLYYRPLYNNEIILPEVVVTPNGNFINYNSKANGGYLDNLTTKPFSYLPIPEVRYEGGGFLKNTIDWLGSLFGLNQDETQQNEGIDLREIAARQAYAESGFDSNAKSNAGAMGLFQIMPSVLQDYNTKNNNTIPTDSLVNDSINTDVRNWYMSDLMDREWNTKNNPSDSVRVAKALGAYNWGSGNLVKALNKAKADGIDIYNSWDWLSYLAPETRDYIDFILMGNNNSLHRNNVAYKTKSKQNLEKVDKIKNSFDKGGNLNSKNISNINKEIIKKSQLEQLVINNNFSAEELKELRKFDKKSEVYKKAIKLYKKEYGYDF